jgi:predicted HAD superfamily Cof-like phosphohydrolase
MTKAELLNLLKPETRETVSRLIDGDDYDTLTEMLTEAGGYALEVLSNLPEHLTDYWHVNDGEQPLGCASDMVAEFHRKMGVPEPKKPVLPERYVFELRQQLIIEEIAELDAAWEDNNLEACADALTDQLYVLIGTFRMFGLGDRISALFDTVHRSNMSKSGGGFRDDGKVLKGAKYQKPNIKHALEFGRDLI